MKRDILKWVQSFLRKELRNTRRRKRSSPIIIAVLVIAVFAVSRLLEEPKAPLPTKGAELVCDVSKVSDGDTVTALCPEGRLSIRVYGIDAPEMGQNPWGDESRRHLQELLPSGQVRLAVQDIDRYNRVVAQLLRAMRTWDWRWFVEVMRWFTSNTTDSPFTSRLKPKPNVNNAGFGPRRVLSRRPGNGANSIRVDLWLM
ncbi:MAG: hypothetical protein HC808_02805 [Candidatus Competibacteraceae bacterium]|nr:hypothetical protein [Candidatus Competibacteraceae bacterium]